MQEEDIMEIRFKLNAKNAKDKIMMDFLRSEYSATEYIKSVIYKLSLSGYQGNLMMFNGNVGNVNVSSLMQNVQSDVTQGSLMDTSIIKEPTENEKKSTTIKIGDEFGDCF